MQVVKESDLSQIVKVNPGYLQLIPQQAFLTYHNCDLLYLNQFHAQLFFACYIFF